MIRWWEHSEKGGRDGRRDGQTDNTICRAAWSQLKTYRLKTFADLRRRWRSCVTRIGHTAAADAPVGSCIQLSHLYASVPPVYFCCSWISWSSRNFRQRSWLHCDSYWSFGYSWACNNRIWLPININSKASYVYEELKYWFNSLQNNRWTVDSDRQNLGRSGKLSFFIIYKFWQNCASVQQVSDLILKTADFVVTCHIFSS